MSERVIFREEIDLQRNPELLSPPYLVEPLYRCATSVTVKGFVPEAELDIEVIGVSFDTIVAGFPEPHGETFHLPDPLEIQQEVRVRQRTADGQSDWSATVSVRDHTEDYPAGPPRPQINPAPVYACGSRTGVGNLLPGGNVWITADGTEVGRVEGCNDQQGVNVNPNYSLGQIARAHFELCGDESAPSEASEAGHAPNPLPIPNFDPIYEQSEQIRITNIVNGARLTIYRNGSNIGTWSCWGGALLMGLSSPALLSDTFDAEQRMCPSDPASGTGTGPVSSCSSLPAPGVYPVQLGDKQIRLSSFVPGGRIEVYLNLIKVGEGSGPIVQFMNPAEVKHGDVLHVFQNVGNCIGQTGLEITPVCIAPPLAGDPSAYDVFPVGFMEYADGDVKGSVYYPAQDDGEGQDFNERLAELGRVPIVFMAHGNHSPADPSYLGYDYFQKDLAKMGMIAVSVDCNALNGPFGGVGNIEDRADLIIENIAHFQNLDATAGTAFSGRIDFEQLGLMGHSRGGDAAVTIPTVIPLAGVTIRSVLSLAPTNFRFWFGLDTLQPEGYAFMTLLPAGDGDVKDNNGAQFYDQAVQVPFKSQLYVHNTNHNFYNREWLVDDGLGPAVLSRHQHERVLTVYGCALFRSTLLGHPGMLAYLSNHQLPTGVRTDKVHLSFEWEERLTVDNHEENNGIGDNSLGGPTDQLGVTADEFAFHISSLQGLAPFNATFFGENLGMVLQVEEQNGIFRSELPDAVDVKNKEVWLRAAEVYNAPLPIRSTGFELGLEDVNETVVWVDSDDVGGLLRPYDRRSDDLARYGTDFSKTMLKTMRFPASCFQQRDERFEIEAIRAVLIRLNREDSRPIAIDDLHIIERVW